MVVVRRLKIAVGTWVSTLMSEHKFCFEVLLSQRSCTGCLWLASSHVEVDFFLCNL